MCTHSATPDLQLFIVSSTNHDSNPDSDLKLKVIPQHRGVCCIDRRQPPHHDGVRGGIAVACGGRRQGAAAFIEQRSVHARYGARSRESAKQAGGGKQAGSYPYHMSLLSHQTGFMVACLSNFAPTTAQRGRIRVWARARVTIKGQPVMRSSVVPLRAPWWGRGQHAAGAHHCRLGPWHPCPKLISSCEPEFVLGLWLQPLPLGQGLGVGVLLG